MKHLGDREIQGYLDGTLGKKDKSVQAHLSQCAQCQELLEQYQKLGNLLAEENIPERLEVLDVDVAPFVAGHHLDAHAGHGRTGRIGAMRG